LLLTLLSSDTVVDHDFVVPLASLSLLYTKRGLLGLGMGFLPNFKAPSSASASDSGNSGIYAPHQLIHVALVSATWWTAQGFYALFLDGITSNHAYTSAQQHMLYSYRQSSLGGIFHNECISFWLSPSWWYPILNLLLLLISLPILYISYRHSKNDSEDAIFILSCLSCLGVVGAHAGCIRYMALLGALLGGWRCHEIARTNATSSKLI
jgi:hypothetical protein